MLVREKCEEAIETDFKLFKKNNLYINYCAHLNTICDRFASMLTVAADKTIQRRRQNFYKFCWDEVGDALKQKSIDTHQ